MSLFPVVKVSGAHAGCVGGVDGVGEGLPPSQRPAHRTAEGSSVRRHLLEDVADSVELLKVEALAAPLLQRRHQLAFGAPAVLEKRSVQIFRVLARRLVLQCKLHGWFRSFN